MALLLAALTPKMNLCRCFYGRGHETLQVMLDPIKKMRTVG